MNVTLTPSNSSLCGKLQNSALYKVLHHSFGSTLSDKTKACFQSNVKTVCCATVLPQESSMHTMQCCRKLHIATETTVMEESNGIHGKPVSPIVFF
jgi:hypothetical protein